MLEFGYMQRVVYTIVSSSGVWKKLLTMQYINVIRNSTYREFN